MFSFTGSTTATIDPPSLSGTASLAAGTVAVNGAALGDVVLVAPAYDTQGVNIYGQVQAAGTVIVYVAKASAGAIDLASGSFNILTLRRAG
jgi:hypothetical protein